MKHRTIAFLLIVWLSTQVSAQEKPLAFVGARIIPIVGEPIAKGMLVVHRGKFVTVGSAIEELIPAGTQRIDCTGKVIMPGLIDTHNHIGGGWGADNSGPIQPDVRVLDSINVRDSGFVRARAGGMTTLNIMPGSGHLLSGQTIYVKLRKARTIEEMAIRGDSGILPVSSLIGGMKMANGTNSQREAPFPGTRSKSAALVREKFVKAQEYRRKLEAANGDPEKRPDRDLEMEGLLEVLDGKRIVHYHTHRADDILTVIRLSQEFHFRVVLHHVSEGWKVADEIAKAGVPCSIILVDSPGGKIEAKDLLFKTGAVLEKAGVLTAFHSDDWINDSRHFLRSPALAVRAGMSREKALEAMTLAGAKMLDLDKRIGSLEVGKDADFIILSGDPLSVYTKVLETYVEGVKVFDRSDPQDYLIAVGGYGAGRDQEMHLCCFEGGEHR